MSLKNKWLLYGISLSGFIILSVMLAANRIPDPALVLALVISVLLNMIVQFYIISSYFNKHYSWYYCTWRRAHWVATVFAVLCALGIGVIIAPIFLWIQSYRKRKLLALEREEERKKLKEIEERNAKQRAEKHRQECLARGENLTLARRQALSKIEQNAGIVRSVHLAPASESGAMLTQHGGAYTEADFALLRISVYLGGG